jgi:hypothetical protein
MPRRGRPHGAAASRARGRLAHGRPVSDQRGRLLVAALGFAGLLRPSYRPRALDAEVLARLLARYRRRRAQHGSARLRSAAYALRRARLARDVLHHQRDRVGVGAHAVAGNAAGGVESFEDAGLGSVGRTPPVVPQDEVVGMELGTVFPIGT